MSPNMTSSLIEFRRVNCGAKRVRRNLFGPIDQDKSKLWVETQLEDCLARACEKWNFDFKTMKPIHSDKSTYIWEPVEQSLVDLLDIASPVAMRELRLDAMEFTEDDVQYETNNNVDSSVEFVKTREILSLKQRQSRITEFLCKRRRPMSLNVNVPSEKKLKESTPPSSSSSSTSTEDLSSTSLSNSSSQSPSSLFF